MKAASSILVIDTKKHFFQCCLEQTCTLVLSTQFFACLIWYARPENQVPRKEFVHHCQNEKNLTTLESSADVQTTKNSRMKCNYGQTSPLIRFSKNNILNLLFRIILGRIKTGRTSQNLLVISTAVDFATVQVLLVVLANFKRSSRHTRHTSSFQRFMQSRLCRLSHKSSNRLSSLSKAHTILQQS